MIITLAWLAVYLLIGASTILLVRFAGPVGLKDYVLEEYYDSETSVYNVYYRIVAPALCCTVLVAIIGLIAVAFGIPAPTLQVLPVIFYWLIMWGMKLYRHSMQDPLAFSLEVISSVGIAWAFSTFVTPRILARDLTFIDESNIAFQAELILFSFIVQIIASLMTRSRYRTYLTAISADMKNGAKRNRAVDTSEQKLFQYEREYGTALPARYNQDPLLRCIFFSIMAIEDSNRPKSYRIVERIACRFGLAHTTGIMQQKADRPLSDRESVELAAAYIGRMWDSFLLSYSKSSGEKRALVTLTFNSSWYKYNYPLLSEEVEGLFGFLYGDYCGTRLHNVSWIFHEVRLFWERNQYNLLPHTIIASWESSPYVAQWFDGAEIRFTNHYTICRTKPINQLSSYQFVSIIGNKNVAHKEEITKIHQNLKAAKSYIDKVTLSENAYVSIVAYCPPGFDFSFLDSTWKVSYDHQD
ncbi:hypothetical protein K6V98_07700 [Collinsella sp. AGMB00827]|uniref:Uncharacterized protein n=1 Tax=Collinsella ureilytica TaxID=2869515 RepID=A0ABS7MLI4_9ACTN|nr:hypothetical protein [Collinsella urealyticum]MBY4798228.1 hypothetical protein [Collinsella urealyticum]